MRNLIIKKIKSISLNPKYRDLFNDCSDDELEVGQYWFTDQDFSVLSDQALLAEFMKMIKLTTKADVLHRIK